MTSLAERAKKIKLFLTDMDGVLTDGFMYLGDDGTDTRAFYLPDGFGMKLLMLSGVKVGVITTSKSPLITRRFERLGVDFCYQGVFDKHAAFHEAIEKTGCTAEEVAYIGDDLPDLPLIKLAGLGFTVANGHHLVKEQADFVTHNKGGQGAVREVCDLIMQTQGTLDLALEKYAKL